LPRICSRSTEGGQEAGAGDRRRLRRPLAATLLVALGVTIGLGVVGAGASTEGDDASGDSQGRELFLESCAICHGADGRGAPPAPAIADEGAAAAHFQITTGRMPPRDDPLVWPPPEFTAEEARAIAGYAGTLGDGPEIPTVDPERGNPALGSELYHENCGACHGPTGRGARMLAGQEAPDLGAADAVEIAEAMLTGPGEMPSFRDALDHREVDAVVRHVLEERAETRGGLPLGHLGPFLEGLVAIFIGLGAIILIVRFGVAR
jgi:ubiquinol-cytochrome c reductase cytochrome c subunit